MRLEEIESHILTLFDTKENPEFFSESGMTVGSDRDIKRVGYCTNLTLTTIEEAKKLGVDLIITHHDAWAFMYGLKEACMERLTEYGMAHYYNHLPLDDSAFGTNESLLKALGIKSIKESHVEDGFYCGRIAEVETEISLKDLVAQLENVLGEPVKAWQFNDRMIKRIGLVCGGGGLSPEVRTTNENECDVYITGEKVLYTIEYAEYLGLNLIIGSHTFTEIFGVESLVDLVKKRFDNLEVVRIEEKHLEALGAL